MNAADESAMSASADKSTVRSPQSTQGFTPGPWRLNKEDLTIRGIDDTIVHVHPFENRDAEDVANARLIAQAPTLFHLALEAIDADDYGPEDWERWNDAAKCAVDLAIGPEPERTIPTDGELVALRPVVAFEVWVRLKKSSKYYHQGLQDSTDPKSKPVFFKLDGFEPQRAMGLMSDQHLLKFNSNSYQREDCEFYLVDPKDTKRFVRIA
jgi:hypothetical protein